MRRLSAFLIVALFVGHMASVAAQAPATPEAASSADSAKVKETVLTWLKRAGSTKPGVLQRAWEGLTPEYQQFIGDQSRFGFKPSKVYSTSNVTVDANDRFNIEVTLSGLINAHGLYRMRFVLTRDLLVDDFMTVAGLRPPDGLTSTTIRVRLTDTEIRVNHAEFKASDTAIIDVSGDVTQSHTIQLFRLKDGQAVDALVQALVSQLPIQDMGTPYGYSFIAQGQEPLPIGIINPEPGTYVLSGFIPTDSLNGVYATFTIT